MNSEIKLLLLELVPFLVLFMLTVPVFPLQCSCCGRSYVSHVGYLNTGCYTGCVSITEQSQTQGVIDFGLFLALVYSTYRIVYVIYEILKRMHAK